LPAPDQANLHEGPRVARSAYAAAAAEALRHASRNHPNARGGPNFRTHRHLAEETPRFGRAPGPSARVNAGG
jgi:hypothetical protein